MKRMAVVAGLLLAAAALAGVLRPEGASAVDPAPTTDTVTVTGTGSVSAVPNQAEISAGVETRGATAQAALDANAAAMRKVIAAIRQAGGRDVTTQTVSLSPVVDPEGRQTAGNGFVATNVVSAKTSLGDVGQLIDAAVEAGANTVWGPTLSHTDAAKLYRDALAKAVADARERATALATAAGRQLGDITTMTEGGAVSIPLAEKAAADGAGTPVVSGPQESTASVSVTFELR
jgi:uncharacterized protein YggE